VTPVELGEQLEVTLALRLEIESRETQYRIDRNWLKPGKVFRLRTVHPCDATQKGLERYYRHKRNVDLAAKRKADRQKHRPKGPDQMTDTMVQISEREFATSAAAKAAMTANIRAQGQALLEAVDPKGSTVAELAAGVRIHASWLALAAGNHATFHRVIWRRLKCLEKAGSITITHKLGPKGDICIIRRAQDPVSH
jgi:hypothetical protein